MQEIVSFCDACIERDQSRVLAEGFRIGIAGTWKRIDLCPDCMKQLLGGLEVVLSNHGVAVSEVSPELLQPRGRKPAAYSDEALQRRLEAMTTPRQCLWCPDIVPDGYAKLKGHIARHGFVDFEEAYGHTCPICLQTDIARLSGHIGRGHLMKLADAFEWAYYGGNKDARHIADDRRALGSYVGAPAQTADAVERGHEARKAWVDAHGEP